MRRPLAGTRVNFYLTDADSPPPAVSEDARTTHGGIFFISSRIESERRLVAPASDTDTRHRRTSQIHGDTRDGRTENRAIWCVHLAFVRWLLASPRCIVAHSAAGKNPRLQVAQGNVGLAFGLTIAAGLCTTVGAAIVFCARLANAKFLAASLGFSAGVMLYVSFAEIFLRKSVDEFEAASYSEVEAYRWSTLAFFGGFLVIFLLDQLVHLIIHLVSKRKNRKKNKADGACASAHVDRMASSTSRVVLLEQEDVGNSPSTSLSAAASRSRTTAKRDEMMEAGTIRVPRAVVMSDEDPDAVASEGSESLDSTEVTESSDIGRPDGLDDVDGVEGVEGGDGADYLCDNDNDNDGDDDDEDAGDKRKRKRKKKDEDRSSRQSPDVMALITSDPHSTALHKMGLLTALAIFIHNFPEGLATFVATLSDTGVGIGIAVAIAVHNIPEGICVALPIYYSTGSKTKAFVWATLSGMSEPLGALIGYFALYGDTSIAFAIVFALVAGMMVYIAIKELLPMALRYDPTDAVTTNCCILGMVVMAASLLLFTL